MARVLNSALREESQSNSHNVTVIIECGSTYMCKSVRTKALAHSSIPPASDGELRALKGCGGLPG